jgi:pimeloyl-ACP methyl ester carboxylesterase
MQTLHGQSNRTAGSIEVNGITFYYVKYGQGKPLLLLHGWTQTSDFWQPYIDSYAKDFEVYAIDLRGHGRSSPLSEDFSIQKAAQDILQFIHQLQLVHVQAIGFSYGGLVLLEVAAREPNLLENMVLIATTNTYNGKKSQKNKPTFTYESLDPSFQAYLKSLHVHGENQIKALFNQNLNYQINIQPFVLQQIQTKVLIINGDRDEFAGISGAVEMHQYIPHSSLWIIPQTGHIAISEANKEEFVKVSKFFLNTFLSQEKN